MIPTTGEFYRDEAEKVIVRGYDAVRPIDFYATSSRESSDLGMRKAKKYSCGISRKMWLVCICETVGHASGIGM